MSGKYLILAVCAVVPSGCHLSINAKHNTVVNEPLQACSNTLLTQQARALAKEAWASFSAERPAGKGGEIFERGFVDGYSDFLAKGGTTDPPALESLKAHENRYLTPEGQTAVRDYLAGFATGAQTAKASGIRRPPPATGALLPNEGFATTSSTQPSVTRAPSSSDEFAVPPTRIEVPVARDVPPTPAEPGTVTPPQASAGKIGLPPEKGSPAMPVAAAPVEQRPAGPTPAPSPPEAPAGALVVPTGPAFPPAPAPPGAFPEDTWRPAATTADPPLIQLQAVAPQQSEPVRSPALAPALPGAAPAGPVAPPVAPPNAAGSPTPTLPPPSTAPVPQVPQDLPPPEPIPPLITPRPATPKAASGPPPTPLPPGWTNVPSAPVLLPPPR